MAWVKRNLGLVIGGVVALALMALAAFYLWSKIQEDQEVTAQLEAETATFQSLLNRPVHPGSDKINNIELAKEENKRLQELLEQVRARFPVRDIPTNISNREYRAMLDRTIFDLQKTAENLGITLPEKDYWFTFAPQKQAVEFKNIQMLTHQLIDVKELTEILYGAKIHDLKRIKRVPASSDDNNQTDFFDKKATTNEYVIVTPYELTFQGFSSELAKVLEGLINSKNCYIVRSIVVQNASSATSEGSDQMSATPMMADPRMAMAMRYGRGVPQTYLPTAPRGQRPPNVLLDESKLEFTLQVDAVRLRPPNQRRGTPTVPEQQTIDPSLTLGDSTQTVAQQ